MRARGPPHRPPEPRLRLKDRRRGVADAGVDIAQLLERKQIRCRLGAVELVGGGLVDGRSDRAGGRVRSPSGVQNDGFGMERGAGHGTFSYGISIDLDPRGATAAHECGPSGARRSSTASIQCRTGTGDVARRCIQQPMLAVKIASGAPAVSAASFSARSRPARSGCRSE